MYVLLLCRFFALSIMYIVMSGKKDEISFFVKDEGSKVRIFIFSDTVEHFCKAKPRFCIHSVQ